MNLEQFFKVAESLNIEQPPALGVEYGDLASGVSYIKYNPAAQKVEHLFDEHTNKRLIRITNITR